MKKSLLYLVLICLATAVLTGCATVLPEPVDGNSCMLVIKRTLKNTANASLSVGVELFFDDDKEGFYVPLAAGYHFITELMPGEHLLTQYKWASQDFFHGGAAPIRIGKRIKLQPGTMTVLPLSFDFVLEPSKSMGGATSFYMRMNALSSQDVQAIETDLGSLENAGRWRKAAPAAAADANLKIETVEWKPDGEGAVQYKTNDSSKKDRIWWHNLNSAYQVTMSTVTAQITKYSGNEVGGFGINFCMKDNNNFYQLIVSDAGQFCIYKKLDGAYTPIQTWKESEKIKQGRGQANMVSVSQSELHSFSVYINDLNAPELNFKDSAFTGGNVAFAVLTSPHEEFPAEPVDVRFKLTAPVPVP